MRAWNPCLIAQLVFSHLCCDSIPKNTELRDIKEESCKYIGVLGPPEMQNQQELCRDIYKRRFIIVIGSCAKGGKEAPQFAVCKLGNQESPQCDSVTVQRHENLGSWWCKSKNLKAQEPGSAMSDGRRRWMSQLKSQWIHLPCDFCSTQILSRLHDAHPHWGGQSALLSLLVKSNLFQKHPHRCT